MHISLTRDGMSFGSQTDRQTDRQTGRALLDRPTQAESSQGHTLAMHMIDRQVDGMNVQLDRQRLWPGPKAIYLPTRADITCIRHTHTHHTHTTHTHAAVRSFWLHPCHMDMLT
mmetsp:Transcript_7822/g.22237  ORF Transcript_7822/g.22237 Transcript_7822/m.22237 type:complete len:114 (-) Transcript_7822:187-528(-)